jgi:Uma2 family endonuclease
MATAPIYIPPAIPRLQNGDHLSREEFERRYEAMPDVKKAELLEGVVYMPSPVRFRAHSQPHLHIAVWLGAYLAETPGVHGGADGSVRLDQDNEPQPDAFLMLPADAGGTARVDADDYVTGAPELVVEVSASTVSRDLHLKRKIYRRNGVREYVVWRVEDEAIDWFVLRSGEYTALQPAPDHLLRSEVFPGLWLDAPALLRGDLAAVLQAVRQGVASPEHEEFSRR